jgi:hypothetical protein
MKFTLELNAILSPVGSVSRWLSSRTLFNDYIHYGSTSPSQIIQLNVDWSYFITCLADAVRTPYENYRVSLFICPKNVDLGIDFGLIR